LGGRSAFVAESNGYGSSRADLSSLAGQDVRFRFRIGTDSSDWAYGWFIDDVRIYTCATITYDYSAFLPLVLRNYGEGTAPSAPTLNSISNSDMDGNYNVGWSASSGATSYLLQEDDNGSFSSPTTAYSGSSTSTSISGKSDGTYYYRVNASNAYGTSGWSNTQSVVVSTGPSGPEPGFWQEDSTYGCAGCSEFYVTSDSAYVDDFAIYIYVGGCGTYKITHTSQESISGDYWSFSGTFYADGTFTSDTTCTGAYGLSSFYIPGCGYVSGGPFSYVSDWQHSAQSAGAVTVEEVDEGTVQPFHTVTLDSR
ncbi:MAG: hypothetical protein PVH17_12555, partial [Anaerolineae bacterium]